MPGFAVIVRPMPDAPPHAALFEVGFQGFRADAEIDVSFWVIHNRTKDAPDGEKKMLGSVSGTLKRCGGTRRSPLFAFEPESRPAQAELKGKPWVGFVMRPAGDPSDAIRFELVHDLEKRPEGEVWEVTVQVTNPKLKSPPVPIAWPRYALPWEGSGRLATYDWHAGNTVKLYNDASEDSEGKAGAFHDIVDAIGKAKHFVFVVDWSFHPLMVPTREGSKDKEDWSPKLDQTIGALLVKKAREGCVVAIHTWHHASLAPDDQNNRGQEILRWIASRNGGQMPDTLFWRGGARTTTYTHHQKFVVLDCEGGTEDRRQVGVFYGGLDLTKGRFDWKDHPILAFQPDYQPKEYKDEKEAAENAAPASINPDARPFLGVMDFGDVAYTTEDEKPKHHPVDFGDDWYNAETVVLHEVQKLKVTRPKKSEGQEPEPGEPEPATEKEFDFYPVSPRQPWHDIHAHLIGPTAWDFVREFVGRWNIHTSVGQAISWSRDIGDTEARDKKAVQEVLTQVLADRKKFMQQWEPAPGPFAAQMLRSMVEGHWHEPTKNPSWNPDHVEFDFKLRGHEKSIQESYLRAIARAEKFVYIETQYLIGSGRLWDRPNQTGVANRIPETLVARIVERAKEKKPFHAYVLIPMYPEGDATTMGLVAVRRFEWRTMWYMIRAVDQAVKKLDSNASWKDSLSFYFLANWHEVDGIVLPHELAVKRNKFHHHHRDDVSRADLMNANKRHMIYIHSKLMIVDDRYLIVGSANLNERSQAGDRDTEDCVAIWPAGPKHEEACVQEIQRLRGALWDEHLGSDKPGGWSKPWEKSCVDAVQKTARENWKKFRTGKAGTGHLVLLPFELGEEGFLLKATVSFPPIDKVEIRDGFDSLPDAMNPAASDWKWASPGAHLLSVTDLSE